MTPEDDLMFFRDFLIHTFSARLRLNLAPSVPDEQYVRELALEHASERMASLSLEEIQARVRSIRSIASSRRKPIPLDPERLPNTYW